MELGACFAGCEPFESLPFLSLSLGAPLMLLGVTSVVARGAETNAVVTSVVTVLKICVVILVIVIGSQNVEMGRSLKGFRASRKLRAPRVSNTCNK